MAENGNSKQGSGKPPFRVLAIDGGGIRGYYTACRLERLVEGAGGDPEHVDLGAGFELLVGTSTGSLIAAALAAGVPPAKIASTYRKHGKAIFPSPAPAGWTNLLWCGLHWRRPSANVAGLRTALAALLGTTTFGDLYAARRVALCVTVTDLRTARGRVLATPHPGSRSASPDVALVDACVASCSAPMLLPPARLDASGGAGARWCDGGLWATSPALVALDEALAIAPADRGIEIVSVGTCPMPVPASVVAQPPGTGIGLWIRALRAVQVAGDAQANAAAGLARRLAPELRREVYVIRLPDPVPEDQDATCVRLDNASPEAYAAMERLAAAGARQEAVGARSGTADWLRLDAIMRSIVAPDPAHAGRDSPPAVA